LADNPDPLTEMTRKIPALLASALAFGCSSMMSHPSLPSSGAFVTQLGVDTISVERYTRTADRLEGDVALRSPRVTTVHYVASLGSNGEVTSLTTSFRRPATAATAPALRSSTITFGPTTTVELMRNGQRDTVNSGVRTYQGVGVVSLPTEPPSYALYEQMLASNQVGTGPVSVTEIGGPGPPTAPLTLTRTGNTVEFNSKFFPGTPWSEVATLDNGRIVEVNSMGTTVKTISHRDDNLDFNGVVGRWAAQEASGAPMGNTSALDTTRASVNGANLQVVYSRPMRRGRVIFGNVVPWGQVWRTGANAATMFTTSRDLMFGNTVVPAGTYTLWTLPTATGAQLIINSQTGQWGTDYDPKRDFARLDLTTTMLASPVDRFTISVDPSGTTPVLRMAWADREYSIPFTVR
jgi:hypothetical protein